MILADELAAAWDQPTRCLVMAAGDTNAALQRAALRFADKVRCVGDRLKSHVNASLLKNEDPHFMFEFLGGDEVSNAFLFAM